MEKKNRRLKYIGIACFIISLILPVAGTNTDDAGIWYLLMGWTEAFTRAGISWWANIFVLLAWFTRKNFKLSLVFKGTAVFFALTFIINGHTFHGNMGIVGGGGGSTIIESAVPGIGYAFWLASLIIFLLRSGTEFLHGKKKNNL
ncbi:hypothetical protein [Pedobacter nototheniae]|uniref:hypothetical protein n=1 Tax=Pedobacter nototheniae TaxID=2488994 RepID=UPI002931407D|nr:hypothetical protein [Pedobacter nototheniae]